MLMNTLRRKMIVLIALPILLIYIVMIGMTWGYLAHQRRQEIESEMKYLAGIYADKFDRILQQAEDIADMTASTASIIEDLDESELFQLLQSNVKQLPFIYGSCMAFEPNMARPDYSLYAPYVYRTDEGLKQMNITREVYDWYNDPKWEWFQLPKQLGHDYWSQPYFDEGAGNVRMITYSVPFYRSGKFAGVTTVDIHLRLLKEAVDDEILASLKFEVFTSEGIYVYSDRAERIMHKTVFDLAREYNRSDWIDFGERITSGQSGMVKIKGILSPTRYWAYYTPIQSAGWCFTCRYPEDQVMSGLRKRKAITLIGLGTTLLFMVGCIIYMSGLITRPITQLNQKVLEVAQGNLDVQIDESSSQDEIGTLRHSFNRMTMDLRTYVAKVARLTKLQRDLEIAKEIQQNTLPKELPLLAGFEIHAWNEPAEETGGDTYDIIGYQAAADSKTIQLSAKSADQAILLLADASGHGIGPALSVTQLRAMLRMAVHMSTDISIIAKHINEQLCADLPPGQFITAWLANIDVQNNTLTYFSAGQGPLLHYDFAHGQVDLFDAQSCPFGFTEGFDATVSDPIRMNKGDIFAVISDGIFESTNAEGIQFGTDRVVDVLTRHANLPAQEILNALRADVDQFTQDAPADDDRTIIIIRRV